MGEQDIILIAIVVMIIAAILNSQINKLTKKIEKDELNPNLSYYDSFCNAIDEKISWLRELVTDGNINDSASKDTCLEMLSNFSKELVFLQTMNTNTKDKAVWEEKLFNFLSKIDDFVISNLKDAENVSQKIKDDLKAEFDKLSS
ncbi:hypothetical protein Q4Y15_000441 [Campylobacter fetus]|uniref:Membrane protein n=3 Tax=Campylobacter fetus TaxID=196 RepID=A0AAE6IYB1_CAMFE|nr:MULTISPECIES: hypothetical protein [Campylobacter]OCS23421.1 hypothetical protein CFVI97532_01195 [Campylobacter fetus subsp. venerealis cfvi97/532]OCS26290.1 hypothetical protein CFVB10_04145 [Campylobacter fetus subsp. venerealis cfvB10]OCS30787.1 hypothetical protein CFVCCUG33900_01495 [Campylobacter fetus subsp. venerealis LMG 6570 = CCUG 33900]OCS41284.1 hypothetical protein CFVI02298_07220 [Campylobacter fetus subsp. venerealis cfvi02/298]ABK82053.1 conserved hypothetical protein [Cam